MFAFAAPSTAMRSRVAPANAAFADTVWVEVIALRQTCRPSLTRVSVQPASISTVKLNPNIGLDSWVTLTVSS